MLLRKGFRRRRQENEPRLSDSRTTRPSDSCVLDVHATSPRFRCSFLATRLLRDIETFRISFALAIVAVASDVGLQTRAMGARSARRSTARPTSRFVRDAFTAKVEPAGAPMQQASSGGGGAHNAGKAGSFGAKPRHAWR